MVGALLGAAAEAVCVLAPNIPFITVIHGLVAGLGKGLVSTQVSLILRSMGLGVFK